MGPLVTTPRAAFWSVMVRMRAMDRMEKIMDAAAMVVMAVAAPAQTVRPESRQKRVPHQRAFGITRTMELGAQQGPQGTGRPVASWSITVDLCRLMPGHLRSLAVILWSTHPDGLSLCEVTYDTK